MAALVAGILWGTYLVPVQRAGGRPMAHMLPMGIGCLLAVLALIIAGVRVVTGMAFAVLLLSGVVWGLGNATSIGAIRALGLSRAVPLFSLSVAVTAGWGGLAFGEVRSTMEAGWIALGIAVSLGGVLLMTRAPQAVPAGATDPRSHAGRGAAIAILTAFLFGTYNAVARAADALPYDSALGMILGAALCSFVI